MNLVQSKTCPIYNIVKELDFTTFLKMDTLQDIIREGFIMQKLEGDGLAFMHAGGTVYKRELKPGEKLRIDTGCLVAMTKDVNYDVEFVGKVKTALFGGEGLFFATLEGPGTVWIQSLTLSRLAARLTSPAAQSTGEGSVLGGLGRLLDGKE